MKPRASIGSIALILLTIALAPANAQTVRTERLVPDGIGRLLIAEDSITGDEIVDYAVTLEALQILSVDLLTSNASAYFNIMPAGAERAIFIGSTAGNVADIPAPATGDYVIRLYLMRSAARRNETADYALGVSIGRPDFADGLFGGPDYWMVSGLGGGSALNLRAGPATRYAVVSVLRNGDVLKNRGCRLTGEERWCRIRAAGSGVTGWVAGRFLVETSAPPAPAVPENGPLGNGTPFDATGTIPCAVRPEQPMRPCPFGVIRDGPGNAGVWIALGGGAERQILFEGGVPVASGPAGALRFDKSGDLFTIRVDAERFEIPEAVVNGG